MTIEAFVYCIETKEFNERSMKREYVLGFESENGCTNYNGLEKVSKKILDVYREYIEHKVSLRNGFNHKMIPDGKSPMHIDNFLYMEPNKSVIWRKLTDTEFIQLSMLITSGASK